MNTCEIAWCNTTLLPLGLSVSQYFGKSHVKDCGSDTAQELSSVCTCYCWLSELMKQLPEVEAGGSTTLSVKDKVRMMGEAQNIIEQMRESGCTVNGEQAGSEQDETQKCKDCLCNHLLVLLSGIEIMFSLHIKPFCHIICRWVSCFLSLLSFPFICFYSWYLRKEPSKTPSREWDYVNKGVLETLWLLHGARLAGSWL